MIKYSAILIVFTAMLHPYCSADDQPEIRTRIVRIVDADGKPISNAFVDATHFNKKYWWPTTQVARIPLRSDSQGMLSIRYPKDSLSIQRIPVESIKITVTHADYCDADFNVPVSDDDLEPYDIQLTPGIEVKLEAVDAKGKPVTKPFAVLDSRPVSLPRWNHPTPSQAKCRSMKTGFRQFMLVQPGENGKHLFSDLFSHTFDSDSEPVVELEKVQLLPGVSVRGKLSDKVPRPVVNGRVCAAYTPVEVTSGGKTPPLVYFSTANLKSDGTFEFVSMPQTGTVQLIAFCQGWAGLHNARTPFIIGQTFEVFDEALEVELEMERTFDAKMRVVDRAGKPVQGVTVQSYPNQNFKSAGSSMLGQRNDSIDVLLIQMDNNAGKLVDFDPSEFRAVSDKEGRLVIKNIPRNRLAMRLSAWGDEIKTGNVIEGKLPDEGEDQVEFDVVVERLAN